MCSLAKCVQNGTPIYLVLVDISLSEQEKEVFGFFGRVVVDLFLFFSFNSNEMQRFPLAFDLLSEVVC